MEENSRNKQRTLLCVQIIKIHAKKIKRKTDNQKKTNNSKYRNLVWIGKNSTGRSTAIMS